MGTVELAKQIVALYERHGWTLRRILLSRESRAGFDDNLKDVVVVDSDFDALWFARTSQGKREAWELRLLSDQPYALFEAFEADESEEDRQEARHEMENRMRDYLRGGRD